MSSVMRIVTTLGLYNSFSSEFHVCCPYRYTPEECRNVQWAKRCDNDNKVENHISNINSTNNDV